MKIDNDSFASLVTMVKAIGAYGPVFYYDGGSTRYVYAFTASDVFVHSSSVSVGTIQAAFPDALDSGNTVSITG